MQLTPHLDQFQLHPIRTFQEANFPPIAAGHLLQHLCPIGLELLHGAGDLIRIDGNVFHAVVLLAGLRRGMGEQVTLYLDRQAPLLVGQAGSRNFIGQTSVLPEALGERLERVPGVALATPISKQFAMLTLHGRRVLPLLVGFDPGKPGGPWSLAAGRAPRASARFDAGHVGDPRPSDGHRRRDQSESGTRRVPGGAGHLPPLPPRHRRSGIRPV